MSRYDPAGYGYGYGYMPSPYAAHGPPGRPGYYGYPAPVPAPRRTGYGSRPRRGVPIQFDDDDDESDDDEIEGDDDDAEAAGATAGKRRRAAGASAPRRSRARGEGGGAPRLSKAVADRARTMAEVMRILEADAAAKPPARRGAKSKGPGGTAGAQTGDEVPRLGEPAQERSVTFADEVRQRDGDGEEQEVVDLTGEGE